MPGNICMIEAHIACSGCSSIIIFCCNLHTTVLLAKTYWRTKPEHEIWGEILTE